MNLGASTILIIAAALLAFVLGFSYGNLLGVAGFVDVDHVAKIAPIITATVATLAFGSAFYGIVAQLSIARKRAALDLFIRTELDKAMVETYEKFNEAVDTLSAEQNIEEFSKSEKYRLIRSILNVHELVAVGVHKDILDQDVCFDFWSDELVDAFSSCKRVVEHARLAPKGTPFIYQDLERLNKNWMGRHKKLLAGAKSTA
jgi:hypothetical protein